MNTLDQDFHIDDARGDYPAGTEMVHYGTGWKPREQTIRAVESTQILATASGKWLDLSDKDFDTIIGELAFIRFNLSHVRDEIRRQEVIEVLERLEGRGHDIPVVWDLQGPELRTLENKGDQPIHIRAGREVVFTYDESGEKENKPAGHEGHRDIIALNKSNFHEIVEIGQTFSIDDGKGEFMVTKKDGGIFVAVPKTDLILGSRKSLNLRGEIDSMETFTAEDRYDFNNLIISHFRPGDVIAPSFVKSGDDLREILDFIGDSLSDFSLMPKIECRQAIRNLKSILELAKYVCAARGDGRNEIGRCASEGLKILENMLEESYISQVHTLCATGILESTLSSFTPQTSDINALSTILQKISVQCMWFSAETVQGQGALRVIDAVKKEKKVLLFGLANAPVKHIVN